jgi:mannosyltransferase
MAIEARSYAFTALVAVWLTVILLRAIDRRRTGWWAVYTMIAAVGVMLNVYVALLVVAHGVSLLISRGRFPHPRRLMTTWGISAVLAAVIASPIVALVLGQTRQLPFGPLTLSGVASTAFVGQYFVGATPTFGRGVPIPPTSFWAAAAIALACCCWALMVASVIRRRPRPESSGGQVISLRALAIPWVIVPFVLILGFSLAVTPIYTARYFSFTTPAVALLMGTSLAAIATQWKRIVAIAGLIIVALPIFASQRGPTSKNDTDWQRVAAIIQSQAKPGEDIYYGPVNAGSTVSTSKIRDAYPRVLAELHDITLRRTGVERDALWDSQWPLSRARSELRAAPILWVVLAHYGAPSPGSTKQQKYIEGAGLRLERSWRGPSTDVLLFTR